jgi:hypothetical protein
LNQLKNRKINIVEKLYAIPTHDKLSIIYNWIRQGVINKKQFEELIISLKDYIN